MLGVGEPCAQLPFPLPLVGVLRGTLDPKEYSL